MTANFFDNLKKRSKAAAHRIVGEQIIKAAKFGLLQKLHEKGFNSRYIDTVSNFIDTELGTTLLSTTVGIAIPLLPKYKNNKLAQSVAKEFRANGLAFVGDKISNVLSSIQKI
jgi:hypothetical protein